MDDTPTRIWQEIAARPDGPMALRFYLQPLMSAFLATRDGLKDAETGTPPFFWAVFTQPDHREELIRSGWKSVGKIFIIAVVLDLIYQFMVLGGFRPLEGLIVSVVLAIVPYMLIRGPVNRLVRSVRRA
jgi:hypothetical protein